MTALDLIRDLGEPGATIAAGSEGARNRTCTGGRRGGGLPDVAVGQRLLQFGDARVGDFVWWR